MSTSSFALCPDRGGVTGTSPVAPAGLLRRIPWPAGTYRVIEHAWPELAPGAMDREWGSAVKRPDGTVELIGDRKT